MIQPGDRFDKLTAIAYVGDSKWRCKCDCGNERIVPTADLNRHRTKSCGCVPRGKKPTTLIPGTRFGRLTVISYAGNGKWRCKCDCGKETVATYYSLPGGHTRSCGCLKRTRQFNVGDRFGRLTVLSTDGPKVLCRCDCGKEKVFLKSNVYRGLSKSCGCMRRLP